MFYLSPLEITMHALLVLIFWRAVRNQMLARYPVFYGYIGLVLAEAYVGLVCRALFGQSSPEYYYAYYGPTLLMPLLEITVFGDIYRRIVRDTKTSGKYLFWSGILAVFMTVLAAWQVSLVPDAPFFHRYHALTLPLLIVVCLLLYRTMASQQELDPGRNLRGMLLGLTVMTGLQTINFMHWLFLGSSYQAFSFYLQFFFFVPLIIFTYTMWDYEPLQLISRSQLDQADRVNEKLQQVVKSLLLPR